MNSPGGLNSPRKNQLKLEALQRMKSFRTLSRSCLSSSPNDPTFAEAWKLLRQSLVYYNNEPIGTGSSMDAENNPHYEEVYVREFVPCALAFLMNGESQIVRNFLLKTLRLQSRTKNIDCFKLAEGTFPASFRVTRDPDRQTETLSADFGERAVGRVTPVDSGFWWIILLRAYMKSTTDVGFSDLPEIQHGIKLILGISLADGFDTFPTLLCSDGCCMIDRQMGIHGCPIEIQSLFYFALCCARELLNIEGGGSAFIEKIEKRMLALRYHIRSYFWVDMGTLNNIYKFKTEEYSESAANKFNAIPDSIPEWVFDFVPNHGGYFIGNVSPARLDFRWFCLGNCMAILSSLATREQSLAILDLIEQKWDDLVGEMPMKIIYPTLENREWQMITGCDPKNTRWSYHNGGSWPVLVWALTAACLKEGRMAMAKRAIKLVEAKICKDEWAEYYDGTKGGYVGKQSRKYQTWSMAGYLVSKLLVQDPSLLNMIFPDMDTKTSKPLSRSFTFHL